MFKSFDSQKQFHIFIVITTMSIFVMLLVSAGSQSVQAQDPSTGPNFTKITMGDIATLGGAVGASLIDFDNDGDLDIFTTGSPFNINTAQGTQRVLYRNEGHDVFVKLNIEAFANADATNLPIGHSWADYDNDGDLDVVVAAQNSSILYRNEGGNFLPATTGSFAAADTRGWSPAWGDYDNDGQVDLFITHPAGFFGNPVLSDLLFKNSGPPNYNLVQVHEGPVVTNTAPYTIGSWSDFDQDGDIDLFVGSGPATGTLAPDYFYRNLLKESGAAAFERITDVPFAAQPRDGQNVNWIDYDNDGDLDFYVTNWGGATGGLANDFYRNDGQGVYTRITEGAIATDADISLANIWGDFDNDGDLDAFIANAGSNRLDRLYLNNGDGTFTPVTTGVLATDTLPPHWGATAGDYDNDGDLDLFTPSYRPQFGNSLYRNDLANGNHWIKIKCIGTTSNRAAIGAKVRVRATINGKSVRQIREISAQDSFGGQNSLDVHFGLGDATVIETIVIEWPSGQKEALADVGANQFIKVTEGGGSTKLN